MRGTAEKIKGAYGVFNFYISTSYKEEKIIDYIYKKAFLNTIYLRF